ncbi:NAD(P)/FAD-dependent oxidoreductase [Patescibacteria group bacterium]|nr:MAG: NAD(P)/FAD-dependent oxidoreductase [Patescibacteria group bacterium]
MDHARYLIVGGGVAGTVAAETLRTLDAETRIVIVSAEDYPLYSRVLLPNYVKGKLPRQKVFLRTWEQYTTKNIEVLRGRTVVSVDAAAHQLALDDGARWQYEKLLVATGGQATVPPPFAGLPHVLPFRTLNDADRIREEVARVAALPEGARRAAVVGGGFIALEFPPFFAPHGIETHLLLRGPRYWHRTVTPEGSAVIEKLLESHGVVIHRNVEVTGAEKTANGLLLALSDASSLEVAAVGVGLGLDSTAPDGVPHNDGIGANAQLETEQQDIWTAGDGAEFDDVIAGRRRQLGNWLNADQQGRCAAQNMAGARRTFENVSQYSTHIFDMVIAMAGDRPETATPRVVSDGTKHVELYERDGILIGATMIGLAAERAAIIAAIKTKQKSPL